MRSQSLIAPNLHVMSYFSLAAFQIFSFSLAFHSLTMIWLGMDNFVFIFYKIHWVSWICKGSFQIWEVLDHYFIKLFGLFPLLLYLFLLLLGLPLHVCWYFCCCSTNLQGTLFFSTICVCFRLDNSYWSVSNSEILSPAISNLLLITLNVSFQVLYF